RDLRFVAMSQRGHGDSERPETGYRMDDFAADVIGLMDALGIENATLVGHSMGSLVAQTVATRYPTRVNGLVLIASATTFDSDATRQLAAALAQLSEVSRDFAREFQTSTLYAPMPDEIFTAMVDESMKVPARVWRDALAGVMQHAGRACLSAIQTRTLLLWGAHDSYCTREEQERLLRAIRHCRLTIYDDLAHAPHWEDPARIVSDLVAFVRGG
ncbi:MAG TPA: alpha/beta hydrolase, partial [Labilithrix sp.]|nr:alpha/beta hydrolase [Labilithrix sp.]